MTEKELNKGHSRWMNLYSTPTFKKQTTAKSVSAST